MALKAPCRPLIKSMPAAFGSSWTQGSGSSACDLRAVTWTNTSYSQAVVLMGFFGGPRAPSYMFSFMDPPIKISNGLGFERLIMGPNAMRPYMPFQLAV